MVFEKAARSVSVLAFFQALVSASSLVVEIVAGRMLAPYVGMSIYTWTSVIAVVLAGFSVGHWWGGRIAERERLSALSQTGWVLMAAAATTAVAVFALHQLSQAALELFSNPVIEVVALTTAVFFLPSLFAGVPAPVLAQLAVSDKGRQSGRALGTMFAAGSIGAIFGTLLAGFLFIPTLGSSLTLFVVTIAYVAAALFFFFVVNRRSTSIAALVLGAGAIVLAAVSTSQASPCTKESQYFCIRIFDVSSNPASPVKRMVLDHLSHGTSARDEPRIMFSEFTAMLDGIARGRMEGRTFSSFFIGGGSYSVPRAWADRRTGPITVAEIDPQVTRAAIDEFWLDPAKIDIISTDARRALLSMEDEAFDVIIGDAFTDIAVPVHLVSKEFFQLVENRLDDRGVFLMNVVDFVDGLHALAAITRTLQTVFPSVEIWTKTAPPRPNEQRTFVLVAAKDPSSFSSIVVPSPTRTEFAALHRSFIDDNLSGLGDFLLTDDYAPVDYLLLKGR